VHHLEINTDTGSGFQGEFDAIDSDGPGPLRCKFEQWLVAMFTADQKRYSHMHSPVRHFLETLYSHLDLVMWLMCMLRRFYIKDSLSHCF